MTRIEFDELGTLNREPTTDGETVINPAQPLPGWHVNATHPVAGWDAWRVTPSTPRRVFAGVPTVHYTFASQADYTQALASADLAVPPPAPALPTVVTMRQARLALLGAGLLAGVDAAIAALPEPQKSAAAIEWEYSQEVHRHRPFVHSLGAALKLTDAQLDALFVAAAAL